LKKFLRNDGILLLFGAIIVLLDQWTKYLVRTQLAYGEAWAPWDWLLPYARIIHAQNTGAAFGMFQGMNAVFTVLAIIVAGVILYYFPKVPRQDWLIRLAMVLQFGGAIGNLVDRVTQGYVVDFISVGPFPVFNVSDACISVGVVLLVIGMWLKEKDQQPSGSASDSDQSDAPAGEDMRGD
jgi:signal peptidase II